jgi:guanylate kinase
LNRGTDKKEDIETRIKKAEYELEFEKDFDISIVNDDLEKAEVETLRVVQEFISKK